MLNLPFLRNPTSVIPDLSPIFKPSTVGAALVTMMGMPTFANLTTRSGGILPLQTRKLWE